MGYVCYEMFDGPLNVRKEVKSWDFNLITECLNSVPVIFNAVQCEFVSFSFSPNSKLKHVSVQEPVNVQTGFFEVCCTIAFS